MQYDSVIPQVESRSTDKLQILSREFLPQLEGQEARIKTIEIDWKTMNDNETVVPTIRVEFFEKKPDTGTNSTGPG